MSVEKLREVQDAIKGVKEMLSEMGECLETYHVFTLLDEITRLQAEVDELKGKLEDEQADRREHDRWDSMNWTRICDDMDAMESRLAGFDSFTPTAENVNALPERFRDYIHGLETRADPAGDVAAIMVAKITIKALEIKLDEQDERLAEYAGAFRVEAMTYSRESSLSWPWTDFNDGSTREHLKLYKEDSDDKDMNLIMNPVTVYIVAKRGDDNAKEGKS